MLFELPHYALELLVVLPLVQVKCRPKSAANLDRIRRVRCSTCCLSCRTMLWSSWWVCPLFK